MDSRLIVALVVTVVVVILAILMLTLSSMFGPGPSKGSGSVAVGRLPGSTGYHSPLPSFSSGHFKSHKTGLDMASNGSRKSVRGAPTCIGGTYIGGQCVDNLPLEKLVTDPFYYLQNAGGSNANSSKTCPFGCRYFSNSKCPGGCESLGIPGCCRSQ
jgi:hypothetical protein